MAISVIEYQLVRSLQEQHLFPRGGDLLEIGEANWYGDLSLDVLRADIALFAAPERRAELLQALQIAAARGDARGLADIAKVFWHTFLAPASITAIDFHGTEIARRGAVEIINASDTEVEAWAGGLTRTVKEGGGSRRHVWLTLKDGEIAHHCSGNPKHHDIFCKHCVAVALAFSASAEA